MKVNRKYYKLTRKDKTSQGVSGCAARRSIRRSRSTSAKSSPTWRTLKSGDLVEVELEIDSKNDYEYLIFEDMKAAGFEPVELRSGYSGNDTGRLHGVSRRAARLLRPQPWPAASTR